ncbi:LysM peptidoglycan-binding domain-containing protein [Candidatus Roizmanbacteria bacterium]|nr:LysM peptidoglycan-binding domain-containing protein [Candidatus Roizmanbacteria bacterium]
MKTTTEITDYQLRLTLLLREKTMYFLLGLIIVISSLLGWSLFLKHAPSTSFIKTTAETMQAPLAKDTKPLAITRHYTVQEGDYLWAIAEKNYGGDGFKAYNIAKANNISNASVIYKGQDLVLPDLQTEATPQLASSDQLTPEAAQTSQVTHTDKTYTVQEGDSLWHIAEKVYGDGYGWTVIAKANGIETPSIIFKGTVLTIPSRN